MADATVTRAKEATAPKSYADFAYHLSYLLHELGFQARAARALLNEYEKSDQVEELTGVSYLLSKLTEECKKLSDDVSNTARTYTVIPARSDE
jgi:hypothetical protein